MSEHEKAWKNRASLVSRKINSGWFLDKFSPILILGGFLFALVVLLLRSMRPEWADPLWLSIGGGVALLVALICGFAFAKRHFTNQRETLVRLDDHLELNNSLVTASKGVGEWPEHEPHKDESKRAGLNWNMPLVVLPLLITIALVAAAIFIPIPQTQAAAVTLPPNEPGAWQQMEKWLEELEEEGLIEEESLEEAQDKIDDLRNQPEEDWFSHSSMEATDSMKESLGRDLQEMQRDLATLERDLQAMERFSDQMSEDAKQMLMKEYNEALKNLGLNNMELNKELAKQLQNSELSEAAKEMMKNMTKEQMQQLQEQLKEGCK